MEKATVFFNRVDANSCHPKKKFVSRSVIIIIVMTYEGILE